MKTGIYLLIFIAWLTVGCSDFLKETSEDEIRPSTVNDLEPVSYTHLGTGCDVFLTCKGL